MPKIRSDELNVFEYVDKSVERYMAELILLFNKLRTKKFRKNRDCIYYIEDFYDDLYILSLEYYEAIAKHYYHGDRKIDKEWVEKNVLKKYDPVTLYVFTHEVERKKGRHIEAVLASDTPEKEHDKAMKYWSNMFRQYADEVADMANLQSLKDSGVKYVMWKTEKDNRVCSTCKERDDQIYKITEVPDKPHVGCRCWLVEADGKRVPRMVHQTGKGRIS